MPQNPRSPGRPKDLAKRAEILKTAQKLFRKEGYNGVSMDSVAKESGVSKQTIYSHFGAKESLFEILVEELCHNCRNCDLSILDKPGLTMHEYLTEVANNICETATSEDAITVFRISISEAETMPKLAEILFKHGPGRMASKVEKFFESNKACDSDSFNFNNNKHAAVQFFNLVTAPQRSILLGFNAQAKELTNNNYIANSVEIFLKAYKK